MCRYKSQNLCHTILKLIMHSLIPNFWKSKLIVCHPLKLILNRIHLCWFRRFSCICPTFTGLRTTKSCSAYIPRHVGLAIHICVLYSRQLLTSFHANIKILQIISKVLFLVNFESNLCRAKFQFLTINPCCVRVAFSRRVRNRCV